MNETLWNLEYSEQQQCFHQDSIPLRHEPGSNGYATILQNQTLQTCQAFIKYIRTVSPGFNSIMDIDNYAHYFNNCEFFLSCTDCEVNFNAKEHGVKCPNCQTFNI